MDDKSLPPYCCVILLSNPSTGGGVQRSAHDDSLRCFVEVRDANAVKAAGHLTCFGGKRDAGEDPLDCIERECREEMQWVPKDLKLAVVLHVRQGACICDACCQMQQGCVLATTASAIASHRPEDQFACGCTCR